MIQRIQTVYLAICCILSVVTTFLLSLWTVDKMVVFPTDVTFAMVCFLGIAILALVSIFLFKNRKMQFVVNRLNIILSFILLGFFVYRILNLSGEAEVSEKGIGVIIPIFCVVLLVLANKAIKKDENLVKSVDRLR